MEYAEPRSHPMGLPCPPGSRDLLLGEIKARGLQRGSCLNNQSPLSLHGASHPESSRQKMPPRAEPSEGPWNKSTLQQL